MPRMSPRRKLVLWLLCWKALSLKNVNQIGVCVVMWLRNRGHHQGNLFPTSTSMLLLSFRFGRTPTNA